MGKEILVPLTPEVKRMLEENKNGDGTQWTAYGSSLGVYESVFEKILQGASIESFVSSKTSPVVVDIMSPADTLRELFSKKEIKNKNNKLGIAVSLSDHRTKKDKTMDEKLNIQQIAGDIMKSSTWDNIGMVLGDRKADLILERGELGLIYLPGGFKFYAAIIDKMWNLLSGENGMLLMQIRYNNDMMSWVNSLRRKGVEAHYGYGKRIYPLLRIDKKSNSPEKLSFS